MLGNIHWLIVGLILGGILGMTYGFGRASLRRQQTAADDKEIGWRPRNITKLNWWTAWLQGISTELVGAVVTAILLGVVFGVVQQRQLIAQQKQELILQMSSSDHSLAVEAARILRARGWGFWEDATLHRADLVEANLRGANLFRASLHWANLREANLEGADLYKANLQEAFLAGANLQEAGLQEANLIWANLQGARLRKADLHGADLQLANLEGADLEGANLQEASLWQASLPGANLAQADLEEAELESANLERADLTGANLQEADLEGANLLWADLRAVNLQGALLWRANLEGANLSEARFTEETTLPDGSQWTPDADLARFTDPSHPKFWQGYDLSFEDLRDRDFRQANLQGAFMGNANLQGVDLEEANLRRANLLEANMRGANLRAASLEGAVLSNARFDEETILPDGSKWAPDTDMKRFTDPNHPDFWRSDSRFSPAFRHKA